MYTVYRLNWYVLLCILAASLSSTLGELTRTCHSDMMQKRGFCGSQLYNTLRLVCHPHGYHWQKRSVGNDPEFLEDSPFLEKRLASSILHTNNRQKRGIICECCKHRCSYWELKEYCKAKKRSILPDADSEEPSQDQVTSNSIDDVASGLDAGVASSSEWGSMREGVDSKTGFLPSAVMHDKANAKTDSKIGRMVRLLLDKSSTNNAP
uniref:Insulin related peptide 2 neuropeptide n=1 Tax=Platynereis dumerilii TaxID=6359 RepID=V5TCR0_PLADU|nr:insulin related peptide 2 neuropeptide precursor [Platynereis dumerilii]